MSRIHGKSHTGKMELTRILQMGHLSVKNAWESQHRRGGQTLPKTSHSRRRPKVAKLYKELNRKCESFERVPKWDFQGLEPGGQAGHPQGRAKLTTVLDLRHHDLQKPPVFNT